METHLFLFLFTFLPVLIGALSLDQLICRRQPRLCEPALEGETTTSVPRLHLVPHKPTSFPSWAAYGKEADDGTGYGSGMGPGYGPGMGDIAIRSGIGIQHPFGGLGIRRDFDLGFGGSGRIGGQPIGFGNGMAGNGLGDGLAGWPRPRPLTNGDMWPMPFG